MRIHVIKHKVEIILNKNCNWHTEKLHQIRILNKNGDSFSDFRINRYIANI